LQNQVLLKHFLSRKRYQSSFSSNVNKDRTPKDEDRDKDLTKVKDKVRQEGGRK